jgi:hypothetical protein
MCTKFVTEWETLKTTETIKTRKVKFGYVDITVAESKTIVEKYATGKSVEYTPTVFVYGKDKKAPAVFDGDYVADSLNTYICELCDSHGFNHGHGGHGRGGYGYGAPKVIGTASSHTNSVLGKSNLKRDKVEVHEDSDYARAYNGYRGEGYGNGGYRNGSKSNGGYSNGGYGGYGNGGHSNGGYGNGGYGGYGNGGGYRNGGYGNGGYRNGSYGSGYGRGGY